MEAGIPLMWTLLGLEVPFRNSHPIKEQTLQSGSMPSCMQIWPKAPPMLKAMIPMTLAMWLYHQLCADYGHVSNCRGYTTYLLIYLSIHLSIYLYDLVWHLN